MINTLKGKQFKRDMFSCVGRVDRAEDLYIVFKCVGMEIMALTVSNAVLKMASEEGFNFIINYIGSISYMS